MSDIERTEGVIVSPAKTFEDINRTPTWYLVPLISVPSTLVPLTCFFYVLLLLARAGESLFKVFVAIVWSFILYRCLGGVATIAALLIRGPAKFFPGAPESWSPPRIAHRDLDFDDQNL